MIRILIFLLSIVFFAFAITYFVSLDSRITGEAFGYRFDGPSGVILGGLFSLFLIVIYITHKAKDIMALPAKIKARDADIRRARGVAALTRGLEAVSVGDAADAAHHARVAQRHLDDIALTRLLSAQAAQLNGNDEAAKASYTAMLKAPETEFLGLKGLYLQAKSQNDAVAARDYAERAFRLRSNASWAFESVIELGLERGAWGDVRAAIEQGRRNNVISAEKADRANAVLLSASAYAAHDSDDEKTALVDVEAALKKSSTFTPAVILAAKIYAEQGKPGKAAKVVESAFATAPHPGLVRFYNDLYKEDEAAKRAERLQKLAAKNPSSREAALLTAQAHILLEEWASAVTKLEPLLATSPTAFEYALMADAVTGLKDAESGKVWLQRAAAAPRDPRPGAEGEFHFNRQGWAKLVREYMEFARLSPPPLEDAACGVSVEEIRLLTAPPMPDVAETLEERTKEAATVTDGKEDNSENESEKPGPERSGPERPGIETEDDKLSGMTDEETDEQTARAAAAARGVS